MAIQHIQQSPSKPHQTDLQQEAESSTPSRRLSSRHLQRSYPEGSSASADGTLTQEEWLAYGLGWFGIGLGLAELIAPREFARVSGIPPGHRTLVQAMGLREIASGIGILTQPKSAIALWSRVAGDMMDLASLGAAFTSSRARRGRLMAATVAVAGATLLDMLTAQQLSRGVETRQGVIPITVTQVIGCSQEELYRYWRDFSNLPHFMKHLESVDVLDARRSHWTAKGPADARIEWDAEVIEERPHELIAWRSLEGTIVGHTGSIRFEPAAGNRGTLITVNMQYQPPLGTLGAAVAAWFGKDPIQTVKMDLRRFKQIMETGEVVTTEGQPAGRDDSTSWIYDSAVRR